MRLFSSQELRLLAVVVGGATFATVLLTVVITTSRQPAASRRLGLPDTEHEPSLDFSDLLLPDDYQLSPVLRWYHFRPPRERWSDADVAEFWVDPMTLGLDRLKDRSDHAVTEFFERIP